LSLIVLQPVFSLCDYKVWIDTERGEEAKNHLRRMVELNLMEEEFRARWTVEHRRVKQRNLIRGGAKRLDESETFKDNLMVKTRPKVKME
jgi:hypothetical protein